MEEETQREKIAEKQDDIGTEIVQDKLPITANNSGITFVPMTVLEIMFEKANHLVSSPGLVVPQPGTRNEPP